MTEPSAARVQLVDHELIERTIARARASERLRTNHNFHPSHADPFHRFLNVFLRGTYCAPHRHVAIPKPEGFIVLRGELACFLFDDAGGIRETHVLGRGGLYGIDIPAGVWHTLLPVSDVAVCYEVKPGPWDPATDKEFAPWAPREGAATASEYAARLVGTVPAP